ncbi:MAG: PAS domain S-box protein [Bryobacteraceae bacterium]
MAHKRILIVEDEALVAEQLRQTLVSNGYEIVGIVASGEQAIHEGRQSRPDLVVMDIVLDGHMDGISVAQQLQPLGVPVVYLSAHSDRHLLDRAQDTEPLGYVMKPAKSGELAAVIQLALFKRDQEQERDRAGQQREDAVREACEQFQVMVAGVTDLAIITLDVAGTVSSWNRGAEKINGYTSAKILGQPHAVLFSAEDRKRGVPENELEVAKRNGSADNTRWLVRENGDVYWAEGVLTAIRDGAGTLTGFTKIIKDGTEHKRTQEALEKSERRLRVALHAARMGTWDWEIRPNKDTLDESLRSLFGLQPHDGVITIEEFYALVHPDDRANVVAAFDQTRTEGIHLNTEFRVIRPDGTERWLLDQGDVLLDEHGQPERLTGACVDITERKQAEQALRESEERFRLFVESVRDYALFQMDEQGHIVSWNGGAERLLGYTKMEVFGRPSALVFVPEDVANGVPQKEISEARGNGRAGDERWHRRKDGSRFWCSGVLTRIDDGQGKPRGFAKIMRDETERRRASPQLADSLAEKELLLKEIHHRVKNNLQVITSLLTLQSDSVEDDTTRTMFDEAVNRVRTIGDIHELLYRSPDLARVDFNLYLKRLVQSLFSFYGVDQSRIHFDLRADDLRLDIAKAIPCGLIVNELLTNALKHAFPDGRSGEILISLRSHKGRAFLEVADNGIGLADDFTIETNTSLGLKLVSVLAKQLQGEVELDPRGGTRFAISFPAPKTEKEQSS